MPNGYRKSPQGYWPKLLLVILSEAKELTPAPMRRL
jgi:hypothetical protein